MAGRLSELIAKKAATLKSDKHRAAMFRKLLRLRWILHFQGEWVPRVVEEKLYAEGTGAATIEVPQNLKDFTEEEQLHWLFKLRAKLKQSPVLLTVGESSKGG